MRFTIINILLLIGTSFHCSIFHPIQQRKIINISSEFDSLILVHRCPTEGCYYGFEGVAFKNKKIYRISIEHDTTIFEDFHLEKEMIDDPTWEDSIKHIDFNLIMSINKDSLDLDERKFNCVVFDGGVDRIISIKKSNILVKSAKNVEVHQECHFTKERQLFLDIIALILRHNE